MERETPWLTLDANTGTLSGIPSAPGANVLIVAANVMEGNAVLCDARTVTVVVE